VLEQAVKYANPSADIDSLESRFDESLLRRIDGS
jgi:hypothetical protein